MNFIVIIFEVINLLSCMSASLNLYTGSWDCTFRGQLISELRASKPASGRYIHVRCEAEVLPLTIKVTLGLSLIPDWSQLNFYFLLCTRELFYALQTVLPTLILETDKSSKISSNSGPWHLELRPYITKAISHCPDLWDARRLRVARRSLVQKFTFKMHFCVL